MTKKAQEYIARRKAHLLGKVFTGQDMPAHLVRREDGVVMPRSIHSLNLWGDRMPGPSGRLKVDIRPAGCKDWDAHHDTGWFPVVDGGNLVVTQAERLMANAMAGIANSEFGYIELGDPAFPATAPQLSDIPLEQTTGIRKAATVTVAGNIVTSEVTFLTSEANGNTYTEAGLFTNPFGAGSMFARKTFNPIVKTNSFEMRFTWLITFLVNPQGSGDCAGVALVGPQTIATETIYESMSGGEASVAATFDFSVGAAHLDVFLNGQRLVRTRQYLEANSPLSAPIGGPAGNKGINLVGFTLNPGDVVYLVQRTID